MIFQYLNRRRFHNVVDANVRKFGFRSDPGRRVKIFQNLLLMDLRFRLLEMEARFLRIKRLICFDFVCG